MTKFPLPLLACTWHRVHHGRVDCGNPAIGGVCTHDETPCKSFERAYRKGERKAVVASPARTPLPLLQCVHRGEPTGNTVVCPSCTGNVQLKTFACNAGHGPCTIEKQSPVAACCKGCVDRAEAEPIKPERIIKVNLPKHYNCSIIEWQGKTLFASRLGFAGAVVHLSELGDDYQPIWTRPLTIRTREAMIGAEDPRFFVHAGQLHLAVTGYMAATGPRITSQLVARLNDRLEVEKTWAPHYAKRNTWEKNFGAYSHDGAIHFVYTIQPHVILRSEGETLVEVARTVHAFDWQQTVMRGGAAPIRVGGEYYSFFHSFTREKLAKTVYGLGLYTFAASPPFQLLRRIPGVLLRADDTPKGAAKSICFPCGAMLRDGKWAISFGAHDAECRIAFFDAAEIERRLK